ncbi:hypothetical protein PILCRDRAFT_333782 [Piloderma croceum F 1598]|uniref:Uncharacterized protein n=1 Tax=Piloderma croceum (strain F 1598) TaxID=765440 RepID=A0A0C3BII3_PILCF|nr:hypothetical protein PILCRDRAFT_333782 [Piloderma croceum F 1598]
MYIWPVFGFRQHYPTRRTSQSHETAPPPAHFSGSLLASLLTSFLLLIFDASTFTSSRVPHSSPPHRTTPLKTRKPTSQSRSPWRQLLVGIKAEVEVGNSFLCKLTKRQSCEYGNYQYGEEDRLTISYRTNFKIAITS